MDKPDVPAPEPAEDPGWLAYLAHRGAAEVITITTYPDGTHVAHLPLPEKVVLSLAFLDPAFAGDIVETVLTLRFANAEVRYRVVALGDRDLIAERLADGVAEAAGG